MTPSVQQYGAHNNQWVRLNESSNETLNVKQPAVRCRCNGRKVAAAVVGVTVGLSTACCLYAVAAVDTIRKQEQLGTVSIIGRALLASIASVVLGLGFGIMAEECASQCIDYNSAGRNDPAGHQLTKQV